MMSLGRQFLLRLITILIVAYGFGLTLQAAHITFHAQAPPVVAR